jgi:RNA polymerase sigma-70 factor (ECF subfamily)
LCPFREIAETIPKLIRLLTDVRQINDDFELIRKFQEGNELAFETLVRKYQRQVANIIFLSLGSRDGLEDLAQDVFIRVYRSLAHFKFDAAFFSWLYRITVNICIDEARKRKLRRALSLDFLAETDSLDRQDFHAGEDPEELLLREERRHHVLQALQRLPMVHRQILILREFEELSYQEISQTLGISVQAVKSRLFRARADLEQILKPYFGNDQDA